MNTDLDTITTNIIQAQQDLHRQQRQHTLARLADLMRARGADEATIQAALEGLHLLFQPSTSGQPHSPTAAAAISGLASPSSPPEPALPGRLLSTIEAQPIEWLWPDRLPLGTLSLLEGISGIGTSLLALTLAASLSSGTPLFDESPSKQGTVILVAPNASPAHLLRPRLDALHADLSNILLLTTVESLDPRRQNLYDRPFSLERDLDLLESTIRRTHAPLVIIDPLSSVLHHVPASRQRDLFLRLAQLAETTHCAILLVRHLSTVHAARNHDLGFPGLVASVSQVLRLNPHPASQQQRLLVSAKHTLTPSSSSLALRLLTADTGQPLFQKLEEDHPHPESQYSHLSSERQAILNLLQNNSEPLSPNFIALNTGLSPNAVRLLLSRMAEVGDITRLARGSYTALSHHPPSAPSETNHEALTAPAASPFETHSEQDAIASPYPAIHASLRPDTFDTSDILPANAFAPSAPLSPAGLPITPDTSDISNTFDMSAISLSRQPPTFEPPPDRWYSAMIRPRAEPDTPF